MDFPDLRTWRDYPPRCLLDQGNPSDGSVPQCSLSDEIHGDWFKPNGRKHHTGAIYLSGHWLSHCEQAGIWLDWMAQVTGHAYVHPDGKAYHLDTDYSGRSRPR